MGRPNIFYYLSNGLNSQEAFICWLLAWADPTNKQFDEKLYACGTSLIWTLLKKHSEKDLPEKIDSVEISLNPKKSFFFCTVNEHFDICIEDRTRWDKNYKTSEVFTDNILNLINIKTFFPIYIKMYDPFINETLGKIIEIQTLSQQDILSTVNESISSGVTSDILHNYSENMQLTLDKFDNYKYLNIPFHEWDKNSWIGFYIRLQNELERASTWREISSKSKYYIKPFMGLWWAQQDGKPYLQLEQEKLCIKLKELDKNQQSKLRNNWFKIINKNQDGNLPAIFDKPVKFGQGNTMTIMRATEDYRQVKPDGLIDMVATVELLKKTTIFLEKIQQL